MPDWHLLLGSFAGILTLAAIAPYIRDILHGTTRPNIVSYVLWSSLILISILAQVSAGASWSLALLIGDFLSTATVVGLCLAGYGYGKYGRLELACFGIAVLAVVSWQLTQEPLLAIILATVADLTAAIPTILKAYRDPWSEVPGPWLIMAVASALAIASTTIFDGANLIFPAYLLLVNGLTGFLALFGRKLKPKPSLI
jgi:hypothetical protein